MKFGVCRGLDDYKSLECAKKIGIDYLEARFSCLVDFDDYKFNEAKKVLESLDLPCLSSNGFIPGEMKIVGESVDYGLITEYVEKGFDRAAQLGIKKIVFGSGAARSFTEGFPLEKAKEQMAKVLSDIVSPRAKKFGAVITIEPLRFNETSMIHTVSQGVEIAEMCGCDNVFALADLYHVYGNNDDINDFTNFKGKIRHAHIAEPVKRGYPCGDMADEIKAICKKFVDTLWAVGCDTCSIEARTEDFEKDILKAVPFLKSL